METNDAPKSNRGRKPSKWQLTDDGFTVRLTDPEAVWSFACRKQAKAALLFARAFGFIPDNV